MVKNLLFFSGSGISFPTGLPDAETITTRLLNEKWHEHTAKIFYPGEHPNEYYRDKDITTRIQKFLLILKEYSDQYLKSRRQSDANYEDLFYLCQQIEDNETFEIDNPLLDPFIKQLQYKLIGLNIYPPIPPINKTIDIKFLSNRSISLIQNVVWNCLSTPNTPIGLDLLIELQKNVEFFDIVTLNHDLIIERVLDENNLSYCDGFGKAEGEIRYFNPSLYDENNNVNLFKLHGSLNWYRFRLTENDITIDKYGMAIGKDHWHLRDRNNHFVKTLDGTPMFLTGSYNKMLDVLAQDKSEKKRKKLPYTLQSEFSYFS